MKRSSQPPGFRFQPTHVELVMFYLKRKVMQKKLPRGVISELDIYKYAPWDLPDKSCMKSGDLKWYFFCPRERKYASGARMNRGTKFGFWKSTGKDRPVSCNNEDVGQIKTLTFFRGKAPKGDPTNWVMHEYRIEEKKLSLQNVAQDAYVLCVIFQKDGPGPRNGAQYGAPFIEEDWDSDDPEDVDNPSGLSVLPSTEPSNSFAPGTSTAPSNIFGCSSASYITENLASTSKEIPQIACGSVAPVEMPQNLDNMNDGITMEELFPDGNSNFNDANGFQATVAASNNADRIDTIFEGLENIDGWSDAFNGNGNGYITDHQVIHSSTFPIDRAIVSSDPMSFLELTDLDIPLSPNYQDPMSFLELNDLNATCNRDSVNEPGFPFSSFGAAYNPGYPDAHISGSSQFAGLQENVPPNSNEGCNGFEASWPKFDWNSH
ncbi:NAC domain-containing protein 82-like [Cucurbita pepo subsp. pepo]|uniref:NAC domain-containing protein 82-like n=1 Tax=Cucurbita pepo subsp. pepo TaxID=3664 RepID=UPI000C9DA36D|nr:NAC domain-containing protein 82-like [Cucurbita pepo subsp. pepo]